MYVLLLNILIIGFEYAPKSNSINLLLIVNLFSVNVTRVLLLAVKKYLLSNGRTSLEIFPWLFILIKRFLLSILMNPFS